MPETTPSRRRFWLGGLLLALFGCLATGVFGALWFSADRQSARQLQARQELERLLEQSRAQAADYVSLRRQARQELHQRLGREAADICANVQIFLQTALVRQESRLTARKNAELQAGRDELAALLQKQAALAARISSAIGSNLPVMPESLTVTPTDAAGATQSIASAPASIPLSDEEKVRLLQEYTQLQAQAAQKMARLEKGEVLPLSSDKNTPETPAQLLRECAADIENLLVPGASFTVAEAGGRVLLTLGNVKNMSADLVRGEATRNLLLPAAADNRHWVLRVGLTDPSAPGEPSPRELAQHLAGRLGLTADSAGGARLVLRVYQTDGALAASFPSDAGATSDLPGVWRIDGTRQRLSERAKALPPAEWEIALQTTLVVEPTGSQLGSLLKENPGSAAGLGIALLALLVGIGWTARLAWRTGGISAPGDLDPQLLQALTQSGHGVTQPRAVLGSLDRLQLANRGRQGEGSRILDLAKSPVLRELASRIRNAPKPTTRRDTRPSLREYNQSRAQ